MSGQQIGSTIGLVVGSYFGGPVGGAIGSAIGGAIGGWIDPTRINGPHIGDGQAQTSTDGSTISWVHGTAWVAGTIVQVSPQREVKIKDSGKGSGQVVSHYEARQDFCILVCESDQNRDSSVTAILMVEQDGKIVYDIRDGSQIISDSDKWSANVDFLYGDEEQLPHPTLEAISGVGNTCAYRGCCIAVFKNFNITQAGSRIPSFRFLVSGATYGRLPSQQEWKWKNVPLTDSTNYFTTDYDDSAWPLGRAPFGNLLLAPSSGTAAHAFDPTLSPLISTIVPLNTRTVIRKAFYLGSVPPLGFHVRGWLDNYYTMYVNGVQVATSGLVTSGPVEEDITSAPFVVGKNIIAVACDDDAGQSATDVSYFDFHMEQIGSSANGGAVQLSVIVERVATRGGLDTSDIDVDDLQETLVYGFPIAKQMNAADTLTPLLGAYFAYGSEFDRKINFTFAGQDATITIDDSDLLEGTDQSKGAVTTNLRGQETEFPKTFVGTYYDPDQNYRAVQVRRSRNATSVTAIGESDISIPVAMPANQAMQAVDKVMKLAYAKLEGTLDLAVPFGGVDPYLTLCAGEPVLFRGKRYVMAPGTISNGFLQWTLSYDRQSAYTSNVQAIPGLPPSVPASRYSGDTQLILMNLPALRPQDTTGIYVAAGSPTGSPNWRGCTLEISYDDQETWQALPDVLEASTMGSLTANWNGGGAAIKVTVNGDLESVSDAQLAANANASVIQTSGGVSEIVQFKTATPTDSTLLDYDLTNYTRGNLGTATPAHLSGDLFTMLDSVYFVPIDISLSGTTLYVRATGFGEITEDGTITSIVYSPITTVVIDGGVVT